MSAALPNPQECCNTCPPSECGNPINLTTIVNQVLPFACVTGYGAVGDGVHDDTAAFLTALAAKDDVFVPEGTYKISQTLVINRPKQRLWCSSASTLNYYGTGEAIRLDASAGNISFAEVTVGTLSVVAGANYGIRFTGNNYSDAVRISYRIIIGFVVAGLRFEGGKKNLMTVDGHMIFGGQWGVQFIDNALVGSYEGNRLNIGTCIVQTLGSFYSGQYFAWNKVVIDGDMGLIATIPKIICDGYANMFWCNAAPDNGPSVFLGSNSRGNFLLIPTNNSQWITDNSPPKSNHYIVPTVKDNLLVNPSFEFRNNAINYDVRWDHNQLTDNTETLDVKHGLRAARLVTDGVNNLCNLEQTLDTTFLAGKYVGFGGWFKSLATNASSASCTLRWTGPSAAAWDLAIPNDGNWHYRCGHFQVPADATGVFLTIYANLASTAVHTVYVDGCWVSSTSAFGMPPDWDATLLGGQDVFPALNINDHTTATVGPYTVLGADTGDTANAALSLGLPPGVLLTATVVAADSVTLTLFNNSGGVVNLADQLVNLTVTKMTAIRA